jgi:hypothetical protein
MTRRPKPLDVKALQKACLDKLSAGCGSLTAAQFAGFLQVSVKTVEDMIGGGELPVIYVGSDNLIKKFPRLLISNLLFFIESKSAFNKLNKEINK